ncbi:hypothetical protein SCA6_013403 [Theobroma cacao]
MSSRYPILDNKPIDQWRVTELKEELKRRKLTTRGLKEDLVKRLDEALRIERENAAKDADNGFKSDPQPVVEEGIEKAEPVVAKTVKEVVHHGDSEIEKGSGVKFQVDINDSAAALGHGGVQGRDILVEEEPVIQTATVQTKITVTETVVSEVELTGQDLQSSGQGENVNSNIEVEYEDPKPQVENEGPKSEVENDDLKYQLESVGSKSQLENENLKPQRENVGSKAQLENDDPKPQLESVGSKPLLENDDPKPQLDIEDSKPQLENEGLKAPHEDDVRDCSAPNNQVSEVSPILGFQVKSDSISTDSVSINEKIELKDNIIADNVKLDLDVVKPEMVEPSSSNVVPVSGESHPMDVEEPLENKVSVDERDDKNVTNADMSKKNDSAEMGYSEKLNLDRSSGDDSMEEDVLDSKQIDSKCSTEEMGEKSVKNELPILKEESPVDVVGDGLSADVENKSRSTVPVEKRKLHDQEAVGNNEPSKRRKWNSDNVKVPERQGSNLTPTTTPKETTKPASLKRNFSRSDSTASEDTPKERVVPPSQKPLTTSLRIDRFLRPFTLKAVQELLGKTGTVTSFWMDHIKTHCFVTYSSVEEAIETRNAIYNLQWPPNGGRLLVADFVDPQEVKMRLEAPPQTPTTPGTSGSIAPQAQSTSQPQPSPRQQVPRQQLPPPALPPPPPLSNPPPVRERLPLPPPPPEKLDPPIVTLDDLFRKTKATPRIYYLPLSEEQVAAKRAARGRNVKQSAGVAFWKELFQPCGGSGDRFWFSEGCFGLSFKFHLALEPFELRALFISGLILLCSNLVFLLDLIW